jgi:RNA polymerase sigma-70 factor, ECF subfamily
MSSTAARYSLTARLRGSLIGAHVEDVQSKSDAEPERGNTKSVPPDEIKCSSANLSCCSHTSDEVLLSLVCEGDGDALSLLFRRYARVIRGVAYKVLKDTSEADELLQDVFLLVHRLCGSFDSSRGSGRFWILQMTYRRAISRRRYLASRHFYTHLDLDQAANQMVEPEGRSGGPESAMNESLDRREALQSCFTGLSESQRQTLHLFFYEGYTFEEIASRLGQTVGNARNHYYRGLEKLRKRISAGKLPGKEAV